MKNNSLYLGLVLPSIGWKSLIYYLQKYCLILLKSLLLEEINSYSETPISMALFLQTRVKPEILLFQSWETSTELSKDWRSWDWCYKTFFVNEIRQTKLALCYKTFHSSSCCSIVMC